MIVVFSVWRVTSGQAITEADALACYPELHHVVTIREAGWRFQQLSVDEDSALVCYFNWPHYIDAVWIFDRHHCLGIRSVDDAPGAPGGTVWLYEGSLADVIQEVLTLPAPDEPQAPSLILSGGFRSLWTP